MAVGTDYNRQEAKMRFLCAALRRGQSFRARADRLCVLTLAPSELPVRALIRAGALASIPRRGYSVPRG